MKDFIKSSILVYLMLIIFSCQSEKKLINLYNKLPDKEISGFYIILIGNRDSVYNQAIIYKTKYYDGIVSNDLKFSIIKYKNDTLVFLSKKDFNFEKYISNCKKMNLKSFKGFNENYESTMHYDPTILKLIFDKDFNEVK